MKSTYELLRENFDRWEIRGRGMLTFSEPVSPRPPFTQFPGHWLKEFSGGDDGVRPTIVSSFLSRFVSAIRTGMDDRQSVPTLPSSDAPDTIEPDWCGDERERIELGLRLPKDLNPAHESMSALLTGLSLTTHPLTFEIVGTDSETFCQWAIDEEDSRVLSQQMQSHFPEAKVSTRHGALAEAWTKDELAETAIVEFGLAAPFMVPLNETKIDPFVGLIGALDDLAQDEVGLYQVIFTPVTEPWGEASGRALCKADGSPYFDDGGDLIKAARLKLRGQLFGVVVRLAARAADTQRAWEIVRGLAPALRHFSQLGGNEFVPLSNDDYEDEDHGADVVNRRTRRCGMLLNQQELKGLVHLPSAAVQSVRFHRLTSNTRRAPVSAPESDAVCIGLNDHDGQGVAVWLSREQRLRHTHIVGGTGVGKSNLLLQMIRQDLDSGGGFAVIDPHGDLITDVLGLVPDNRIENVVLIDPSDEQSSVGFNILSAASEFEKTQLASDLVSVFRRTSSSWGDQMNSVLANAIQAFLDHPQGGTLPDLRRFLVEPTFRQEFLGGVLDPEIAYYWSRTFPQLGGSKSLGPILTRLENFLSPKPIRYMVAQQSKCIDVARLMDEGRILLARLPQGLMGRENGQLLGALLVMRFQLAAINRQRMEKSTRRPFWLYIDEFQDFVSQSMAEILTGARKYGLGMVLAHQQLGQLQRNEEVASAVLSNACTRIIFRSSDDDARYLERGLAHFTAKDIQSLPIGQTIVRLERSEQDFNLRVPYTHGRDFDAESVRREQVIETSRRLYARPRSEVEAELRAKLAIPISKSTAPVRNSPAAEVVPPVPASSTLEPAISEAPGAQPAVTPVKHVAEPEPLTPRPSGMGRGGSDHQWLVEQFCKEGGRLGYRTSKEFEVPNGRIDVVLEKRGCRIAVEVAVNSNTSHELENLRKGLESGFDFVVSTSPLPSVIVNIERSASKVFQPEEMLRLRFLDPEQLLTWLAQMSPQEEEGVSQDRPAERRIAGRRVKIKQVEMSREERMRIEVESLEALADIISKNRSNASGE